MESKQRIHTKKDNSVSEDDADEQEDNNNGKNKVHNMFQVKSFKIKCIWN